MPAKTLMGWEPRQRLWRKTHKGEKYVISCRQLSEWSGKPVAETKDGSGPVANDWWRAKLAEASVKPSLPADIQDRVDDLHRRREIAQSRGETVNVLRATNEIARLESGGRPKLPVEYDLSQEYSGIGYFEDMYKTSDSPQGILDRLNPIWIDRLASTPNPAKDSPALTIASTIEDYMKLQRTRVDNGHINIDEHEMIRNCVGKFEDWAGGKNSISVIDAAKWEEFWSFLIGLGISSEYKRNTLKHVRAYIRWTVKRTSIGLPNNLDDRYLKVVVSPKAIVTMTIPELTGLITASTGPLKLYLMLMANCGLTQWDIAKLTKKQVDWDRGRIIRRRSKTERHANVPVVEYQLWPQTLELMNKYLSEDPVLVFLNSRGRPLMSKTLDAKNRMKKTDNIRSLYRDLLKRLNKGKPAAEHFTKTLKIIRKTSSSLIDNSDWYGKWSPHFLGHAPSGIAATFYNAPSPEVFDRVVRWLGVQYGYLQPHEKEEAGPA